jgi:hypothetical protein
LLLNEFAGSESYHNPERERIFATAVEYLAVTLFITRRSSPFVIYANVGFGNTPMKRRLPAGDTADDRKAMRDELLEAKKMLGKLLSKRADKILKKPRKELSTSVPEVQGGQMESNRRKF